MHRSKAVGCHRKLWVSDLVSSVAGICLYEKMEREVGTYNTISAFPASSSSGTPWKGVCVCAHAVVVGFRALICTKLFIGVVAGWIASSSDLQRQAVLTYQCKILRKKEGVAASKKRRRYWTA